MFEPVIKINLRQRNVWDESDPEFQCFVQGCRNKVVLEHYLYHGGEEKQFGKYDSFDAGTHFGILNCSCQSPVCDSCLANFAMFRCRLCGQRADVDIIQKNRVMSDKNVIRDETNRGFWMMKLTDAQEFIDRNLGENYPKFLEWFLARGGEIHMTEMNSAVMCENVTIFKLFCLKMVFLKSTFTFMRQLSDVPFMSHYEPRFEKFMRQASEFVGSLQLVNFRRKDLKIYRLFGLMMKMIEKIADSSVVLIGRPDFQRNLLFLFPRIFTRINGGLLNL